MSAGAVFAVAITAVGSADVCESEVIHVMCKYPFMRLPGGQIRWGSRMTEEERLSATPFPCGKCLPCRINKRREWQHRIMLECGTWDCSSFLTLTYNDNNIPNGGNLSEEDFTNFLKRLRHLCTDKIRYFGVGEYGDKTWRPHYHLALFGVDITDGDLIDRAWSLRKESLGHHMLGTLTSDSASYVSGYIMKKMTKADDPRLGGLKPEFVRMSKGLGRDAITKIAAAIKSNTYYKGDTIRELLYGKNKKMPLGRFLTSKLCDELEIPEEQLRQEFKDYQNELFEQFESDFVVDYYIKIVQEKASERHAQEKKTKIYERRKL